MQKEQHFTDKLADEIQRDDSLDDAAKAQIMRNLAKMRNTKVNILITGATGCGKSSTINALFGKNAAKVGQGVDVIINLSQRYTVFWKKKPILYNAVLMNQQA